MFLMRIFTQLESFLELHYCMMNQFALVGNQTDSSKIVLFSDEGGTHMHGDILCLIFQLVLVNTEFKIGFDKVPLNGIDLNSKQE